jgi:hypothetical protein
MVTAAEQPPPPGGGLPPPLFQPMRSIFSAVFWEPQTVWDPRTAQSVQFRCPSLVSSTCTTTTLPPAASWKKDSLLPRVLTILVSVRPVRVLVVLVSVRPARVPSVREGRIHRFATGSYWKFVAVLHPF